MLVPSTIHKALVLPTTLTGTINKLHKSLCSCERTAQLTTPNSHVKTKGFSLWQAEADKKVYTKTGRSGGKVYTMANYWDNVVSFLLLIMHYIASYVRRNNSEV